MTTQTIAVLGLGAMGARMAARLLEAGFEVRAYNRTKTRGDALQQRGATICASAREAARGADVVLSMVRDDQASRSVWLDPEHGALAGMSERAIGMESSTLSPPCIHELAEAFAARRMRLVDAPVVGTRPQADAGSLVFLVGGEDASVQALKPVFDATGGAVHHLGPLGKGSAMKLAVNALFAIQVASLGELLGSLARGGIEPAAAMEVLGGLAVTSPAAKGTGGLMVREEYSPLFPVELVAKDLGYASAEASRLGGSAPISSAAADVFAAATKQGYGAENLVAVAKLYRP
ncbi:MAG: NAD(P)-dependent oxidoreductase [Nannocystales bacterium]